MEIFAARLKWLRERNNFTQKEMAERLGVSQPYYGRFEKGTGQPNLETLVQLPAILGESLDFICGVILLDSQGYDLLYTYFGARKENEYYERMLNNNIKLLNSIDLEIDFERKLATISRQKDRLDRSTQRKLDHYNKLLNYIRELPGSNESMYEIEFWDKTYKDYLDSQNQSASDPKVES
ncbi:helix-turn-helix domain-containing protein [Paenibacillus urinalis]|uniref:helix-turn-helix domain-containing protein n=1 Tax=Paenibacillus urinalis TaxID=521520 RepID=UPI001960E568